MDPGTVVVALVSVVSLFLLMPYITFEGIKSLRSSGSSSGAAMRRSELEATIAAAVDDATEPLRRRIEALEAIAAGDEPARPRVDAETSGDRIDPALLADALGEEHDDAPAAVRRRARR